MNWLNETISLEEITNKTITDFTTHYIENAIIQEAHETGMNAQQIDEFIGDLFIELFGHFEHAIRQRMKETGRIKELKEQASK